MASMMPAAHAHATEQLAASPDISTEPLATLSLDVHPGTPVNASAGSAIIAGGAVRGARLQGAVLPGSLEWSSDLTRGVTQLTLHYGVLTEAGDRLQVTDRASFPSGSGSGWARPITTFTEMEAMADPLAALADISTGLTIGRLDASGLGAGSLRLELHRVL